MGMLFNRLLIILNEEDRNSTNYHIALLMLEHIEDLQTMSIGQLAALCDVSKSTVSKFIRYIGYEDFSDFRCAAVFRDNKYRDGFNYASRVME